LDEFFTVQTFLVHLLPVKLATTHIPPRGSEQWFLVQVLLVEGQVTGVPLHLPLPSHVSPVVQFFPSLQAVVLDA